MIARRGLILAMLLLAIHIPRDGVKAAPADDPLTFITAIYTQVASGKGDRGGGFVVDGKASRAKYLSKSLAALWGKADAHTPKGDAGPVDFDPITNSQDPAVKSFKVNAEAVNPEKASIAVTLVSRRDGWPKAADGIIRYDLVREANSWKIDDIKGSADGQPWSVRDLLANSLKQ